MSWWTRISGALRPRRRDAELQEELQFHLESRVRDGMTPQEARRALGGYDRALETCRDADGVRWLENGVRDLRLGVRTLLASPLFTVTAVVSLALGIGANSAVFTLLRASLWRPLPVPQPEQLVQLQIVTPSTPDADGSGSYVLYEQVRAASREFGDATATASFGLRRFGTDSASSERIVGEAVAGNYFSLLHVDPAVGRVIEPADDSSAGGQAVAVLSHAFWARRFQADPSIVGRTVWFRETRYTVVGVAREGFGGVEAEAQVDVWVPISAEAPKEWLRQPHYYWLRYLARFRPGTNRAAAEAKLNGVYQAHMRREVLPEVAEPHRSQIAKRRMVARDAGAGLATTGRRYRKALFILFVVAGLVLLISCANVANLILARNAARKHEIAVRMALGAGRGRIAAQLLAESLLLAAAGAATGVAFAAPACRMLVSLMPQTVPPLAYSFRPDANVLGFATTIATLMAMVFGLAPAWGASRDSWKSGRRTISRYRSGGILVAGQLALSLLLLIGAGLFLSTLRHLESIDLGFRTRDLVRINVNFPRGTPDARMQQAYAAMRLQLRQIPGIEAVTQSWPGLYASGGWSTPVERDDTPRTVGPGDEVGAMNVGPSFFEVVAMRLTAGRFPQDRDVSAAVAVVNEKLARKLFGGESALGRRIRLPGLKPEVREVIGVVADAHHYSAREDAWPTVYMPSGGDRGLLVRSRLSVGQLDMAIRKAIAEAGPAEVEDIRSVDSIVQTTLGRERLVAATSSAFGGLATLLAAIGLYGVLAYSVSRRTAELGIRMALGAQRGDVRRMVFGETLRITAAGTAAGLAAAYGATRLVQTMLYGVQPTDALTLVAATLALAAVAAVAAYLPARRASRIDPMTALRYE